MSYEIVLIRNGNAGRGAEKSKNSVIRKKKAPHAENSGYVGKKTAPILCIATAKGRRHDFPLIKESQRHFHRKRWCVPIPGLKGFKNVISTQSFRKRKPENARSAKRSNKETYKSLSDGSDVKM
jgi:hypothetical protein